MSGYAPQNNVLSVNLTEGGYSTDSKLLENISFSIDKGEIVGLIGPNGAGKSTTIKAILGILNHVNGDIHVNEYAYIPERPIFYDGLTLWEHIDFLISVSEVDEQQLIPLANELLETFRLSHVVNHYPENFSKGMQQKGMIVLALLKQPSLYIIDEPFMGLDPTAINKLLAMINQEKERGTGILISTHVLDTAEKICDRFILISNGKVISRGTLGEIRRDSCLEEGSLFDCFDVLTERDNNDW